ncbi:hypothetical protein ACVIU7_007012 [Bradyrhizobium liaoningense]|nr:hypothetical protein GCM10007858_08150 [Bradyrhizobium liaoningense]
MELGNAVTVVALRSAIRLAWTVERAARALGAIGERLESAVEREAQRRQVDLADVLGSVPK